MTAIYNCYLRGKVFLIFIRVKLTLKWSGLSSWTDIPFNYLPRRPHLIPITTVSHFTIILYAHTYIRPNSLKLALHLQKY